MTTKKTDEPKAPVEPTIEPTDEEIAAANAAIEAEEAAKAEAAKAAKASKKSVNLDKKLAGQGTFAVGVQAMMRNRINKRG